MSAILEQQALVVREEAPLSAGGASEQPMTLLQVVQGAAMNPACDVQKLEALLRMAREEADRDAKKAFVQAMLDAQNEMVPIARNAKNESTGSPFATLEKIDNEIGPIYKKYGLGLTFSSLEPKEKGNVRLRCKVMHRQGHCEEYELEGALDLTGPKGQQNKTGIQALGSSSQYIRRYLTLMIFNLIFTNEDNDGQLRPPVVTEKQASNITDMISACELKGDALLSFWGFAGANMATKIRADRYDELMRFLHLKEEKIRGIRK